MSLVSVVNNSVGVVDAELIAEINREHRQSVEQQEMAFHHFADGLRHALNAGSALIKARNQLGPLGWYEWVEANCDFHLKTCSRYIRLAYYRDDVERWIAAGGSTKVEDALRHLQDKPPPFPPLPPFTESTLSADAKNEIVRLRKAGLAWSQISKELGVHYVTVRKAVDPVYRRDRLNKQQATDRRRKEAAAALRKQEAAKAAAVKRNPDASKAYALIRKTALALDAAAAVAGSDDERNELLEALRLVHKSEDHVTAALRITRVKR